MHATSWNVTRRLADLFRRKTRARRRAAFWDAALRNMERSGF